jgi:hypothetical protein
MTVSLLADWDNFYVIVGSAAAGLTGLTFVVISLAAGANRVNAVGLRAFVTPTIVHFGTVLGLSAFLSVPHQTLLSLRIGLGIVGGAGLVYLSTIAASISAVRTVYVPVREDWLWNVVMPALVYAALLVLALLPGGGAPVGLHVVAGMALLLLFIGIRNAWDVAVWHSTTKPSGDSQDAP